MGTKDAKTWLTYGFLKFFLNFGFQNVQQLAQIIIFFFLLFISVRQKTRFCTFNPRSTLHRRNQSIEQKTIAPSTMNTINPIQFQLRRKVNFGQRLARLSTSSARRTTRKAKLDREEDTMAPRSSHALC